MSRKKAINLDEILIPTEEDPVDLDETEVVIDLDSATHNGGLSKEGRKAWKIILTWQQHTQKDLFLLSEVQDFKSDFISPFLASKQELVDHSLLSRRWNGYSILVKPEEKKKRRRKCQL